MNNCRQEKALGLVRQCASDTGLKTDVIKHFIWNMKRRPQNRRKPPKLSKGRKISGREVFNRDFLKSNEENKDIAMPERMRMATARWVAMTSEEKEGFKKKAKEEAEKQETVESYSAADRRALRKRTIKEILNLMIKLHSFGGDSCLIFCVEEEEAVDAVTCGRMAGFITKDLKQAVMKHCTGKESGNMLPEQELLPAVYELFRKKYDGGAGPWSYNLDVTVEGLPDGIPFKKPSCYGVKQLRAILDNEGQLTIKGLARRKPGDIEIIDSDDVTDEVQQDETVEVEADTSLDQIEVAVVEAEVHQEMATKSAERKRPGRPKRKALDQIEVAVVEAEVHQEMVADIDINQNEVGTSTKLAERKRPGRPKRKALDQIQVAVVEAEVHKEMRTPKLKSLRKRKEQESGEYLQEKGGEVCEDVSEDSEWFQESKQEDSEDSEAEEVVLLRTRKRKGMKKLHKIETIRNKGKDTKKVKAKK